MADTHYQTLGINQQAELAEIKQAYRKLAKAFHPDCNQTIANSDRIIAINQAYEILSNPQARAHYDLTIGISATRPRPPAPPPPEDSISQWLKLVSSPVFSLLEQTINSFEYQIECLSADPFDDELLANFSDYIDQCRQAHQQAQHHLRQRRAPTAVGTVASHLFHALNALGDGIEELNYFTLNFDDRHLHTAQELWHRAEEMRAYAQYAVTNLTGIGAKH